MPESVIGQILAIAVRTSKEGPMREIEVATAQEGAGIDGDLPVWSHRGITLISADDWRRATSELQVALPWHTRRANVLVEGLILADLIGRQIRFGEVVLQVRAETKPCELMDRLQPGLWKALRPDCRAGVYGKVQIGGEFAVGDSIEILD